MSPRLVALRAAVVLAIVLLALALWQMREAAALFAIAVAVAAGLAPLVDRLAQRGIPRARAAALVFGGGLLAALTLLAGSGYLFALDLAEIVDRLPLWYLRARDWLEARGGWLAQLAQSLPGSTQLTAWLIGGEAAAGTALLSAGTQLVATLALTLGAIALGFYWLLDEQRITRLWLSLLPLEARTRVRALGDAVYREIGIYVRGVVISTFLTTSALLVIYQLAGIPGATVLALAGGLAQVVPLLGVPLALLPGATVALTRGEATAAIVLAAALIVVAGIRLALLPRLLQGGISVNPVLTMVAILALAELGGIPLILLAPPLAAALQAATRALISTGRGEAARSRATRVVELEERLEAIAAAGPSDDPRLQSLLARARMLLADAREVS